jgi:predicted RND superfamily exporter protein
MTESILRIYAALILRRPAVVLALVAIVLGALATQLPKLRFDASADALVLEGDKDLEFFREVAEQYGSEEFLVVTYQPKAPLLSDESLAALSRMRDELAALPGVSAVTSILDVPLLQSPPVSLSEVTGGEGLPTLRREGVSRELALKEFTTSPIYRNLLASPDGLTTAVQVSLERDERYISLLERRERLRAQARAGELGAPEGRAQLKNAEAEFKQYAADAADRQAALVQGVRDIVDGYRDQANLFVGGVPMIAADMVSFIRSDLVIFGGGILLFTVIVLALIFRALRFVVIPLVTCASSALFMLGFLAAIDWRMTVISSNFVALLLIITLAISIHLIVRYREVHAKAPDDSQHDLVLRTVRLMFIPCFYTAITTIVAFVSLVVSGLRPVIDFGWMMTIGICVALLLTFVLLPAMLVMLRKTDAQQDVDEHHLITGAAARVADRHGSVILWVSLLLLITSAFGLSKLQVENRFIDYFDDSTEIYQGMELLDAELGGTIPLDIILTHVPDAMEDLGAFGSDVDEDWDAESTGDAGALGDADAFADEPDPFASDSDEFAEEGGFVPSYWFTTAGMNQLKAIHDYIDSLPETGKVLSLATLYDVIRQLLGGNVGDVELALVQRAMPAEVQSFLIDPYFSAERNEARISLRARETSEELRRDQFLRDLRIALIDDFGLAPENIEFTGMLVLYNNVLQSLFKSQILTLGVVFVAIMLMFLVLFRSLTLALIAIAPNLLAAGIVLAGMGFAGIPLDIMTITIAAIVVGIGVDHAIHYVHRFKREFPLDRNYTATMYRCHDSIGQALFYTSITVIAGFSILALSNFTPSIYFGLLTGLAMFAAVVGSLLLLPRLILLIRPLGPESR